MGRLPILRIVPVCICLFSCIWNSGETAAVPGLNSASPLPGNLPRPVLSITLPASWDENWFSSPAVYDLDADGAMEIIASRHSVLYVWWPDGELKWRAPVGEDASSPNDHGSSRMYCSPAVGDFDGDGKGEIAVSYGNRAAVYEHDGSLKPGWPVTFPGPDGEVRSIAASDLDNDGAYEILAVKTSDGPVTNVWDISGQIRTGWPQVTDAEKNDFGGYNQNIGSADLDGDGRKDIISTYDICHVGVFYPDGESYRAHALFSGTWASNVPMFHDIDLAIQGWGPDGNDRDEFTDSPPVMADLDGDGLPEIVLFSDHERAGEYINRGNSLWALNPDMTRVPGFEVPWISEGPLYTGYENNIVQVAPSPCLARLDESIPSIVVPSYDGNMYCFSGNGSLKWKAQFDTPGAPFIGAGEAAAGDLDGDGNVEIIFTTYSTEDGASSLFILNREGVLLYRIPIEGRGSMSAPTLADVDGNGTAEILLSLKDALGGGSGGLQIWVLNTSVSGSMEWPTGRGNILRTGEYTPL